MLPAFFCLPERQVKSMSDVIDELKVQIDASASNADAKIDKFINKMLRLHTAISAVEMSGSSQVAAGINQIANAVADFNQKTKTADFSRVTRGLNKLSGVDVQGVSNAARAMSTLSANLMSVGQIQFDGQGIVNLANSIAQLGRKTVTQAVQNIPLLQLNLQAFIRTMNGLQNVSFDASGLATLVSSITKLGGKAATNAIPNIKQLGVAFKDMMTTLSKAPYVSQNVIQLANAMASLAGKGTRAAGASRSIVSGINNFSRSAKTATKHTKGLVSQIGMFYAKCFLLIRGIKSLWKATESSMDYVETLNYFDVAWEQVGNSAISGWKEAGYGSAEEYAKSFSQRAKQLTGKMTGFQPDENGNLVATGMQSLGLDVEKTMNYQATFGQMASSMGVASETALKLSDALTMIGADLASVKNMDFEDVWQDMASGMVGMSRTLDKYGVNIRNVNLQQKLNELGINANISALNQQDKALLRVIVLLESTKYAWADMSETISSPANQLRLLQANFTNLARTIGSLFLPVVAKVLPYVNALVIAVQRLFAWIGGLLGIDISKFSSSVGSASVDMGDLEDSAGGVADDMGAAADNAKKMASNLQGFDKLNVINSQNEDSGGSGAGGGLGSGILDDAFLDAFSEYQKVWDEAFAKMENTAQATADKISNAFKRIWETAEPAREAFMRLWNEGFAEVGNFAWTGLKDFYNEFLVPIGKWTLGEGLPRFFDITNNFLLAIDWGRINDSLRNFWKALEPFAENVGRGLLTFYEDLSQIGAKFINTVVPGAFNGLSKALNSISPGNAERIGYALGAIAVGMMGLNGLAAIASGISALGSSFHTFSLGISYAKEGLIAISKPITSLFAEEGIFGAGGAIATASTPVLILTASIAALAAGLGIIFATNEDVRKSFSSAASTIAEGLSPAIEFVSSTVIPDLQNGFQGLMNVLSPFVVFLETVFTSVWQDMINPALTYVGNTVIPTVTEMFKNLWSNVLVPFGTFLGSVLSPAVKLVSSVLTILWQNVGIPLAGFIGGTFEAVFEYLAKIFNDIVVPKANSVITAFQFLWNNVFMPIGSYLVGEFGPTFESAFKAIGGIIDGLTSAFKGLIQFVTGVFTNDWRYAWEGVKNVFKGVFNGVISIAEYAVNHIIRGLNKLSFDIPDWIPELGGKTFGFQIQEVSLPRFEYGGFPEDGVFLANHNEIIGQFDNGRSVVANNRQITDGIALAVQSGNAEMISELRRQNDLLQIIANKPVINKGDIVDAWKSGAKDFRRQTGRQLGIAY